MPEGEDRRAGDDVAALAAGGEDVFVAQRGPDQQDQQRGNAWNDGEREPLSEGVSHSVEFSYIRLICAHCYHEGMRSAKTAIYVTALLAVLLAAWTTVHQTRRQRHSPFGAFSYLQTGGECLVDACDPYDYAALNREAQARHEAKPPIFPQAPVYPASTLLTLVPFQGLGWPAAAYVLNGLAGLATALACSLMAWWLRVRPWDPAALVMVAALISLPMASALEFANPALLVAASLALACLLLLRETYTGLGWVLLGLALALKPQLAIGVVVVLLCKRETRSAALKACGLALLLLVAGLLAYRVRLGSFHYLASLKWALWLAQLPGGSSDYANKESFDFLNLQNAFGAIPHIGRGAVNALAWLTTVTLAAAASWVAAKTDALRRRPWTMVALGVAISLLPVYHRGYDRVMALLLVPAALEIGASRRGMAWVNAALVTVWVANNTVMAHVLRRWQYAPQSPVEDVVFCMLLLVSLLLGTIGE